MPNLSKLGDIYFTEVEEEDYNFSNDITNNSVEDGSTVSDNVHNNPSTLDINGILIGTTAYPQEELNTLQGYAENGDILAYIGIQGFEQCAIETFNKKHTVDVGNGITFSITLKKIKIATKQSISINVGNLNIPDIEALKAEMSAQSSVNKAAAKARITGITTKGRTTKKKATATSVLQKIKDRYKY